MYSYKGVIPRQHASNKDIKYPETEGDKYCIKTKNYCTKTKDLEEENKERRRVEAKLRVLNERQRALVDASVRFVPRPFLEFLGRSDLTLVRRGDSTRQQLGILFSDLRGFTSLAEGKEPQYIFELLNRYLDAVVPAIHEHHGFVDKYIGDAIMALFPKTPEAAIQAGVSMFHRLYNFTDQDLHPFLDFVHLGL